MPMPELCFQRVSSNRHPPCISLPWWHPTTAHQYRPRACVRISGRPGPATGGLNTALSEALQQQHGVRSRPRQVRHRHPRFYLSGIPAHIVQRGNNRQAVFFSEADYSAYLDWLAEGAQKHGCAVHAYVLMTNHVHLLLTPRTRDSISRLVQFVGRKLCDLHKSCLSAHRYPMGGTAQRKPCWTRRLSFSLLSLYRAEPGTGWDGEFAR
jgi:REP element-mobilizing transposase RayT